MSLKVEVKNNLAVRSADIEISGITVLAGVNGCGKSTISKSLFELLSGALNYNNVVDSEARVKLFSISQSLFTAVTNASGWLPKQDVKKISESLISLFYGAQRDSFEKVKLALVSVLDVLEAKVSSAKEPKNDLQQRQRDSFITVLAAIDGPKQNLGSIGAIPALLMVRNKIESITEDSFAKKTARSIPTFQAYWKSIFKSSLNPEVFNVFENGMPIYDSRRKVIGLPDSVKRVFYIDSPMAFNENESKRTHWNALNAALRNNGSLGPMFDYASPEPLGILNGSFEWNDNRTDIEYSLPDGTSFELFSNGATGLKSFTILQNLFREGFIDERTLLILDEPEAHLHPQWVVHFGRFLVMLRKETGCRFLISSHSTDMISTLRYVTERELGCSPDFYLATNKVSENPFTFDFEKCGEDIEPIFNVFNQSFRLVDLYSEGLDNA